MVSDLVVDMGEGAEAAPPVVHEMLAARGVRVASDSEAGAAEFVVRSGEKLDHLPPPGFSAVLSLPVPRDVVLTCSGAPRGLQGLERGTRVGVDGVFRARMLAVHRPEVVSRPVQNLDQARAFLLRGDIAAWITAEHSVRALGRDAWVVDPLETGSWATRAGRGMLVLAPRVSGNTPCSRLRDLDESVARNAFHAEVAVLTGLGLSPAGEPSGVGVSARAHGELLRVSAMVPAAHGRRLVRGEVSGVVDDPERAGHRLAAILRARGALRLLEQGRNVLQ